MGDRREPADPLIAAYFGGRLPVGERRHLRDRLIAWMHEDGVPVRRIGERFGLAPRYVYEVIARVRAALSVGKDGAK